MQGVKRNAIKIENVQNTEQPLITLSVFRDARLCARVCLFCRCCCCFFFFSFLLAFFNGLLKTAINRKLTTIFKFCKLQYLSSLGTFQPLFYDFFVCTSWHNSHRSVDCSDVLTYNWYFNSSSMWQLNFLTFIDN